MSLPVDLRGRSKRSGRTIAVGVTEDQAARVAVVNPRATEVGDDVLTRRKVFYGRFADAAGSTAMNVNGAVTPVDFRVPASSDRTVQVDFVRFVFNDGNMNVTTADFRRFASATAAGVGLTNGLRFFAIQGGITTEIFSPVVRFMGDFFNFTSEFKNFPASISVIIDFLSFDIMLAQPVVLPIGSLDRIVVRVQDNLTALDLFQVYAQGYQEID